MRVADGMARDRPSPYGERETALHTVARGPVPRDRPTRAKNAHRPRPFPLSIEAWRGTGPRPTVNGDGLANRSAGACPPRSFTCPRDCSSGSQKSLFSYQHFAGCREITGGEGIEIDTTCHAFTLRIAAVPMRRAAPALIDACRLITQFQSSH